MSDAASNQIITLGTTDKTYTFTFTNWVSAKKIKTSIMLGAFNAQYDYAGENSVRYYYRKRGKLEWYSCCK